MNEMISIPDRFPSVLVDRFACIMDRHIADMMIQMEMAFDHRLDLDRLGRALRLALDAEPILGCRFVDKPPELHWRRLPDLDRELLEVTEDEKPFSAFRTRRIHPCEGPQLAAALLHEEQGDRLLIKLSHLAGDAGGTKEAVGLIALCLAASRFAFNSHQFVVLSLSAFAKRVSKPANKSSPARQMLPAPRVIIASPGRASATACSTAVSIESA